MLPEIFRYLYLVEGINSKLECCRKALDKITAESFRERGELVSLEMKAGHVGQLSHKILEVK